MQFDFTKDEYEYLKEKLMLNEELSQILEMKIKGDSITKMSLELKMSESTINRRIKELKKKIMKVIWHEVDKEMIGSFLFFIVYLCQERRKNSDLVIKHFVAIYLSLFLI